MISVVYGLELCKWDNEKSRLIETNEIINYFHNVENCHHKVLEMIYDEKINRDRKNINREKLNTPVFEIESLIGLLYDGLKCNFLEKNYDENVNDYSSYNVVLQKIFSTLEVDFCPQVRVYEDYWGEENKNIFRSKDYSFAGNNFSLYYRNPKENPDEEHKPIAYFHMIINNVIFEDKNSVKVYGVKDNNLGGFCIVWLDYYKEKDQDGVEWYYRNVAVYNGIDKVFENKQKFNLINSIVPVQNQSKIRDCNSALAAYLNNNFRKFENEIGRKLDGEPKNTKLKVKLEFIDQSSNSLDGDKLFLHFYVKDESMIPLSYEF